MDGDDGNNDDDGDGNNDDDDDGGNDVDCSGDDRGGSVRKADSSPANDDEDADTDGDADDGDGNGNGDGNGGCGVREGRYDCWPGSDLPSEASTDAS